MPLDPVIHQATRLRIMALLQRNREARATAIRDALGLTDGNLASHAARLVEAGYVAQRRALSAAGFELRYRITPEGVGAFLAYAEALRLLMAGAETAAPHPDARRDAKDAVRPRGPRA